MTDSAKNKIINQEGYILFLLPFLILFTSLCLSAVLATTSFIQIRNQYQHLCRKHGLIAQREMKKSLKQILSLNPWAKSLNKAHDYIRFLRNASIITLAPPVIITLDRIDRGIAQAKKIISMQQKIILEKGHSLAYKTLIELKQRPSLRYKWAQKSFKAHFTPVKLRLRKIKKNSRDLPIYQPVKNFSQKQKIHIWWQASLSRVWQKLFSLNNHTPSLHGSCTTTLTKQEEQWLAILY